MSAHRLLRLWGVASLALALFIVLGGLWVCRAQDPVYDSGTHERLDGVLIGIGEIVSGTVSVRDGVELLPGAIVSATDSVLEVLSSVQISLTELVSVTHGLYTDAAWEHVVTGLVALQHALIALAVVVAIVAVGVLASLVVAFLE